MRNLGIHLEKLTGQICLEEYANFSNYNKTLADFKLETNTNTTLGGNNIIYKLAYTEREADTNYKLWKLEL